MQWLFELWLFTKNYNSVLIYSLLCSFKLLWLCFLCATQREMFYRMFALLLSLSDCIPYILNSYNSLVWGADWNISHEVVFSKCGQKGFERHEGEWMVMFYFWVSCFFKRVLLSSILDEWLALLTLLDEIRLSETRPELHRTIQDNASSASCYIMCCSELISLMKCFNDT